MQNMFPRKNREYFKLQDLLFIHCLWVVVLNLTNSLYTQEPKEQTELDVTSIYSIPGILTRLSYYRGEFR